MILDSFGHAFQVAEIQSQLALHEQQAAHCRRLLEAVPSTLDLSDLAAGNASDLTMAQSQPGAMASGMAVNTPDSTMTVSPSCSRQSQHLCMPCNAPWQACGSWQRKEPVCQARILSRLQRRATQSMSRSASCRSDVSISPKASVVSPSRYPAPCLQQDVQASVPDVGITPEVYLARNWIDEHSYLATTRTNLSAFDAYNDNSGPSACPSLVSSVSAIEPTQPLTRQSSTSLDGASMMRFLSTRSWQTTGDMSSPPSVTVSKEERPSPACDKDDIVGVGSAFPRHFGGAYHTQTSTRPTASDEERQAAVCGNDTPKGPSALSPRQLNGDLHPSALHPTNDTAAPSTTIQRCTSDTSAKTSVSGSGRRFQKAHKRVLENSSKNVLAPKPEKPIMESTSAASSASTAPSKREGKVALQKTPYQRPKHPRVHCVQCNDHPDGFRGDHELRRHLSAKHRGIVKKFVCRDPALVGIEPKIKALYPLSECRACTSGKHYGAYYNAAAHLRRTHFKPRASRGKNKGPTEERRGGKGGGDWPPMADLKIWFQEVPVMADNNEPIHQEASPDESDQITTDSCDHMAMTMFPEFEPMAFTLDNNYALPLTSAVNQSQDDGSCGALNVPHCNPMASAVPHMACLKFENSPYAETSPDSFVFASKGQLSMAPEGAASVSPDASPHTPRLSLNPAAAVGYVWGMQSP